MEKQEVKYTNAIDYINKIVTVKIDRKLGTTHPKYGFYYELNYGYIPNTISQDKEELDAYILGVDKKVDEFTGRVIAVIHRLNDNDDKLIVTQDGKNFTDEQITKLTKFQEKYFKSVIIR